ncbi:MAG TPA: VOC family protein [Gammaproteobacteria bacterium]|nr:VOC family protein [Gammaproteobacteria bacterium]
MWASPLAVSSLAQTPAAAPPPAGPTIGLMHAIHATNNVDKTLAFYTDVFGVTTKIQPFENPNVPLLTDSPGVKLRVAMLRWPGRGMNFELTEFTGVPRTPAQPQVFDPGAPFLSVQVRDLAPVVAALEKSKAAIITTGGKPVRINTPEGGRDAIMFRDPDGYIVEAIVQPPQPDTPDGNVLGANIGMVVADLDESLKFWNGQLGFGLAADPNVMNDPATLALAGLPAGSSFRVAAGLVPGSTVQFALYDLSGTPAGKPFSLRVPDPGASGMAIRVADIEKLLPKLKAAGVRVISKDGALVPWSDTVRNVFVKDPNGLNIEIVGNIAAPAAK